MSSFPGVLSSTPLVERGVEGRMRILKRNGEKIFQKWKYTNSFVKFLRFDYFPFLVSCHAHGLIKWVHRSAAYTAISWLELSTRVKTTREKLKNTWHERKEDLTWIGWGGCVLRWRGRVEFNTSWRWINEVAVEGFGWVELRSFWEFAKFSCFSSLSRDINQFACVFWYFSGSHSHTYFKRKKVGKFNFPYCFHAERRQDISAAKSQFSISKSTTMMLPRR